MMNAAVAALFLAIFASLAASWFLVPFAIRKRAESNLAELCRSRKLIVLTYDDGPGTILTPRLAELLKRRNVKATFYSLGRNAERHPEATRLLLAEGHEIGSHTYNHSNAWKTSPWRAARDLRAGIAAVAGLGGDRRNFRPPFGKLTLAGLLHGHLLGLRYGWWTIDSQDSWARRPIAEVLNEISQRGGGVVLMHDFDTYAKAPVTPSHVDHVLELTARILDLAEQKGFHVVPMSALSR